jgi:hypothetical protein
MLPKKKTLGLVHIPKKIHLFQSLKKTLLKKRGGITPFSLPNKKKLF